MEIQEIEVVICKDGRVELSVRGVKGQACLEMTKELEKALGGILLSREMTSEAFEETSSTLFQSDENPNVHTAS